MKTRRTKTIWITIAAIFTFVSACMLFVPWINLTTGSSSVDIFAKWLLSEINSKTTLISGILDSVSDSILANYIEHWSEIVIILGEGTFSPKDLSILLKDLADNFQKYGINSGIVSYLLLYNALFYLTIILAVIGIILLNLKKPIGLVLFSICDGFVLYFTNRFAVVVNSSIKYDIFKTTDSFYVALILFIATFISSIIATAVHDVVIETSTVKEDTEQNIKEFSYTRDKSGAYTKYRKAFIIIILIAIAVIAVVGNAKANTVTELHLEDYCSVNVSGYDGYGEASVSFDDDKLKQDLKSSLEKKNELEDGEIPDEIISSLESYSLYSLDNTVDLNNGDEVTVTFDYDDINNVLEPYKIELTGEKLTKEVSDLSEVQQYNPFDDISVSFNGAEPNGSADIVFNTEYPLYVSVSQTDHLSNGDTITVTICGDEETDGDSLLKDYGIIITQDSKEYTVSNLSSYVKNVGELSSQFISDVKVQALAIMLNEMANEYDEDEHINDRSCVAGYFLSSASYSPDCYNMLYLIYRIAYSNDSGKSKDYYYYVRFSDVMNNGNGEVNLNTDDDYEVPTKGLWGPGTVYIDPFTLNRKAGYNSLDDLYENVIQGYESSYSIDEVNVSSGT